MYKRHLSAPLSPAFAIASSSMAACGRDLDIPGNFGLIAAVPASPAAPPTAAQTRNQADQFPGLQTPTSLSPCPDN